MFFNQYHVYQKKNVEQLEVTLFVVIDSLAE
jgi:hypothetical protein